MENQLERWELKLLKSTEHNERLNILGIPVCSASIEERFVYAKIKNIKRF